MKKLQREQYLKTVVIIKWVETVIWSRNDIDTPLCGELYNQKDGSIVHCPVTDPDAKMTCFAWSRKDIGCIFGGTV